MITVVVALVIGAIGLIWAWPIVARATARPG
jgi:hypothetical protein